MASGPMGVPDVRFRLAPYLFAAGATLLSPAAHAAGGPKRSAVIEDLAACRGIADGPARLACFDQKVSKLLDAEDKRDVVVVDREQVRETRRSLFGLALPRLAIFGRSEKEEKAEEIDHIETTLVKAYPDPMGRYIFLLTEGGRWHQIDSYEMGRDPKPGDKVVVSRAALGAFRLSVAGKNGVKVRREN